MKKYLNYLEWELLQENLIIDEVFSNEYIPVDTKNIEVYRDELYNIKATLSAVENVTADQAYLKKSIVGKPRDDDFVIKAKRYIGMQDIELKGCYIEEENRPWSVKEPLKEEVKLTLSIQEIEIKIKSNEEPAILIDWYLNGPIERLYPRTTKRKITLTYNKTRSSINGHYTNFENNVFQESYQSSDFAYIDTGNVKFLISASSKDSGPRWSNNIGIEFRSEFGAIPDFEQRRDISEIVSFIFGRPLTYVGHTVYGINGEMIQQQSTSPHIDNLVSLCQKPSASPIDLVHYNFNLETTLNKITPEYLRLHAELNLDKAFYLYWVAQDTVMGPNLPIFSSALELIYDSWFKSTKSKTKGHYMEEKEFKKLLGDELSIIEQKLCTEEFGSSILNKIKNSCWMSDRDKFKYFFKEIDLITGDVENKAIKARNPAAHGSTKWDRDSFIEMIENSQAYKTLLNKVILKLLGYDGYYIDMSTHGFPPRKIDEPLGGNIKGESEPMV